MSKKLRIICIVVSILLVSTVVFASDGPTAESNAAAIDMVWTLIAAFLVFFMQLGFAMVETGFTRAKNSVNIIMKNLMDFSMGSVAYWVIGYALMFGATAGGFIGTSNFFIGDGNFTFWLFQCVFAATAATIVSGAMAERTKFVGYLAYSIVISGLIYPIVGHWIWGGGWLTAPEGSFLAVAMDDFAGSTVVHSVGGWAALAGAIVLGPRTGKYGPDGKSRAIRGHNIPLAALGVFILWFGWFGFNPGSTTAGTDPAIALIATNTSLAASTGAIGAMIVAWIQFKKPDASMTLNGALAGLVGITAGCASVDNVGAVIIGFTSGILVVFAVEFIDKVLKIDDPVGAISVHGVCGAWGTIMVGFFSVSEGIFYVGKFDQLFTQVVGVVAVFAWTFLLALALFTIISKTIGLRVSKEEEIKGLDIEEHGNEAYAGFQIFSTEG